MPSELKIIAGVDEAGRGPLAGPVVAAAVILPQNHRIDGLADSKKISPKKRAVLFQQIKEVADLGIGIVSHRTIDNINILQATFKAMKKAINGLPQKPEKILVDGTEIPNLLIKNEGIIHGDEQVESISAASIVAKVTRDEFMKSVDPIFPEFGFAQHKGYGTKQHMKALQMYRATPIHRKSFEPVRVNLPDMAWLKYNKKVRKLGVQLVALRYINQGYKIQKLGHPCGHYGNLDIIATKDHKIIFVDVKTGTRKEMGNYSLKEENRKLKNLESAIKFYLFEQGDDVEIRLDMSTVILGKNPIIKTNTKIPFK